MALLDKKEVREEVRDKQEPENKQGRGGMNLLLMGLLAIVIALTTTGVSLAIYHNSGDIYLDRSRPGFLPDEEEASGDEDDGTEDYDFAKDGAITKESLEEYLKNLSAEEKAINAYEKPFDANVLSDEHLGITVSEGEIDE